MKNPWIPYLLARVGLFALFLAIFLLLRFDPIYSSIIAAVLALAASLVFLQKQRDALSRHLYQRLGKNEYSASADEDNDEENRLLDRKENGDQPEAKP